MKHLNQLQLLRIKTVLPILIVTLIISSCKKEEIKSVPFASLTLVNAVTGGTTAKFGGASTFIYNNDYSQLGINDGEQNLYIWPYDDSLHPYFTYNKLSVQQGETYSIFLTGTATTPDGILIKENIPYRIDSTGGIRFINLSPNSTPLNITLSTTPTVNEVSNLTYKQYTDFKTYPTLYNSSYTFQIRAASVPNTVLTSISLPASQVPRFSNITLVIRQNGSGVAVFRVNNDR
jgi:hypothetical protein